MSFSARFAASANYATTPWSVNNGPDRGIAPLYRHVIRDQKKHNQWEMNRLYQVMKLLLAELPFQTDPFPNHDHNTSQNSS